MVEGQQDPDAKQDEISPSVPTAESDDQGQLADDALDQVSGGAVDGYMYFQEYKPKTGHG
jgi:hypothetical protein